MNYYNPADHVAIAEDESTGFLDTNEYRNPRRSGSVPAKYQTTLSKSVNLCGVGVHSGQVSNLTLHPASADHGITFRRKSDDGRIEKLIPAHVSEVSDTRLCTILGPMDCLHIATVEHLMAALVGMGVDNVAIEVDAREVPVMDGSSLEFVKAIQSAGIVELRASKRYIRILRRVEARLDHCHAMLEPYDGSIFDMEIDFASSAIGRQRFICDLTPENFASEIAGARTFGFLEDAKKLRAMGLAQGSSLENSVVIDGDVILNEDGLRFEDEFVRHKLLDAIGDLALAGAPILGMYKSVCGGHRLNSMILEALFADPRNWCFAEAELPADKAAISA